MAQGDQDIGFGADIFVRGNTRRLLLTVTTDGTTPKDLTGATVIDWEMSERAPSIGGQRAVVSKSLGSGTEIVDATGGQFRVTLDPADTAALAPGDYYHEAVVVDSDGDRQATTLGQVRLAGSLIDADEAAITFTVEDGTGLAAANSYDSVANIRAYAVNRNLSTILTASDERVQAAAILATDYIDIRFEKLFTGIRLEDDQALAFPRSGACDAYGRALEGVPLNLRRALAEYVRIALERVELLPTPPGLFEVRDSSGNVVSSPIPSSVTERLGPWSESRSFSGTDASIINTKASTSALTSRLLLPEYPKADLMIETLIPAVISKAFRY